MSDAENRRGSFFHSILWSRHFDLSYPNCIDICIMLFIFLSMSVTNNSYIICVCCLGYVCVESCSVGLPRPFRPTYDALVRIKVHDLVVTSLLTTLRLGL